MYYWVARSSCKDSLKVLEEDVERANALAAAIPRAKHGSYLQMKLVYNQLAPLLLFLMQWVDCSCTCILPRYLNFFHILVYKVYTDGRPNISAHGRKATVKEFYAIILPSLQRLQASAEELDNAKAKHVKSDNSNERRVEGDGKHSNGDLEREDECGICLEQPSTKMVLPNCCHSMCIKCYHNWNMRSESCPFCRGSLKRIKSEDLWVLTGNEDVVDAEKVSKEDVSRFYLYITTLPKEYPDALFLVYYEFLI
ncbi:E3 ubiquitin-protein ligase CHFR-like [Cucurbita pepo subsp. pepo]|uniref:E3 ubiquitin-protein ligase CHFR-like n=1 Tax=Cucurbita pepo subsp. pepo TaxID=3664 RepID=UPI000C9D5CF0|nr:E3 ubiquitin-protein ligase CHFR-like [Cucurbita pepo subsp. pepo]XP_023546495.1 E3 ubiquitin-protein ligase CHFR-like [Cucurbita pepo subsp. pepo]